MVSSDSGFKQDLQVLHIGVVHHHAPSSSDISYLGITGKIRQERRPPAWKIVWCATRNSGSDQ
jgi:hypothetical protein